MGKLVQFWEIEVDVSGQCISRYSNRKFVKKAQVVYGLHLLSAFCSNENLPCRLDKALNGDTHFSISIQQKLSRNITFDDDIQYIHSQFLAWKNEAQIREPGAQISTNYVLFNEISLQSELQGWK